MKTFELIIINSEFTYRLAPSPRRVANSTNDKPFRRTAEQQIVRRVRELLANQYFS